MSMTFQQLHCIRQIVANGFSVSRTAEALFTTQPGVSKMVRALEEELGIVVFARRGNRLVGLTDAGREAYSLAGRILQDSLALRGLRDNGQEGGQARGTIRLGTTHVHARYRLLPVTGRFLRTYPHVQLEYSVGTPPEIHAGVRDGSIDIGLSTMPSNAAPDILSLRAYEMERCLVVPQGHPLLALREIEIRDLADWPWIVHDEKFTSGAVVQRAFQMHGLQPRIVMRAMDVDVMKAYVAQGVGIAALNKMAMEGDPDPRLRCIEAGHIFPASMAMVMVRRDHLLKPFAFDFIRMLLPRVRRTTLVAALGIPT
ncbi:LysR substrate-binding domain-containing protein [Cupriavidus ulmosensis]